MATVSTHARSRHASREVDAITSRPPSSVVSPQLNAMVRYPPPDPLDFFSSGVARDAPSLTAVTRQIAVSRAPHSAPASQSSYSFVAVRPSQAGSTTDIADRAALHARRPSLSPTRTNYSHLSSRAEPAGGVIMQVLARFVDQLAAQSTAQSAAQLTALSTGMQRFETLHPATPPSHSRRSARQPAPASLLPSRRASTSPQRSPHRQSALNIDALQGVNLPFPARPLAQGLRATSHHLALSAHIASPVLLGAVQQSHQLAPPSLARLVSRASLDVAPPVLPTLSTNLAESPQSGLLLAPLAPPALSAASLPSLLQ